MPLPPDETHEEPALRRDGRPRAGGDRDHAAAELALTRFAREHDDIVTTDDLRRFGLGRGAIRHRISIGRLHRRHRGVYAWGSGRVSARGRRRAALLACGSGARLSHMSGIAQWGLLEDHRLIVDVTVPGGGRDRTGIRAHDARDLLPEDLAVRDGLPVTSVARCLADLAGQYPGRLEEAVREAKRRGWLDVAAVGAQCGRGRPGTAFLREILRRDLTPEVAARSELELRFVRLCRSHGIPLPEVNVWVEGFLVDAFWREERVVVELDGYAFHDTPRDQRRDAARNRALALAGIAVLRYGWVDVTAEAATTASSVIALLRQRSIRRNA